MGRKNSKRRSTQDSDMDEKVLSIFDDSKDVNSKQICDILYNSKVHVKCKNKKQKEFVDTINKNQITLGLGQAGVGKSYLSVLKALQLLCVKENAYQKIIIVTPIVEADERIGFLKGGIEEKIAPYLYSTYYIIDSIIGKQNREKLVSAEIIQPMVLAYMRGVNIDNSILLFEEAQNSTPSQMKTLLTRIGHDSKFIITGDLGQSDRYKDFKMCGLYDASQKLKDMDNVGVYEWVIDSDDDIVRNPLINRILEHYVDEK